jgi:hypothetical protein
MKLSKIVYVSICAFGLVCAANADLTYKTQIRLMPTSEADVQANIEGRVQMLRRSGQSEATIKRNRESIKKASEQEGRGFVTEGTTTVFFDGHTAYVSVPSPNLSDPEHPDQSIAFFDGTNTFQPAGPGQVRMVVPNSVLLGMGSPPAQLLLGRYEVPTKLVEAGIEGVKHYKISEFSSDGGGAFRMKTTYDGSGRILSIDVRVGADSKGPPIALYEVRSYDKSGLADHVVVSYFDHPSGKTTRTDEFWLTDSKPAPARTPADIFKLGDLIIDERLGDARDDQVSYKWTGSLPSLPQLQSMHLDKFKASGSAEPNSMPPAAGGFLVLCGGSVLVRRRKLRT